MRTPPGGAVVFYANTVEGTVLFVMKTHTSFNLKANLFKSYVAKSVSVLYMNGKGPARSYSISFEGEAVGD